MGLNLSRGKPIKYYSSDRIAQLLGNGLLTFIHKDTMFQDFLKKNEVIFYENIDDLNYKINKYNETLLINLAGAYQIDAEFDISKKILKEINFYNVSFPLLMIPFISRLSFLIGKRVSIEIDEYNFKFNLDKYMFSNNDINSLILENAKNIRIIVFENEDSFSQEVWDELYELSTDTFVEENEKLKSTAAGAGLEDND